MSLRILLLTLAFSLAPLAIGLVSAQSSIPPDLVRQTVDRLVAKHGQQHADRIRRGVKQAAQRWWAEGGERTGFVRRRQL